MKKFLFLSLALAFVAACSSKPKEVVAEQPVPTPPPAPSMAHANLKAVKGKKVSGMVHFTQDTANVRTEVMFQGLKSGPYLIQVSDISDCAKVSINKNLRSVGEVTADRKGVVKTNLEVKDTSTSDLTGRTLILQTNSKKKPSIVACGLVETMI